MSKNILGQEVYDRSKQNPEIRNLLLKDRTTHKNIIWATEDYESFGTLYRAQCEITPELLTETNRFIIQPRITKSQQDQANRTRHKAEVFTPSWICNAQNNLIDTSWFGRSNVFNVETNLSWETNSHKIAFPDRADRTWQNYVDSPRMEITCGEAPYLVSRYDAVTARPIALEQRIGMLDRKLRIVNENTDNEKDWLFWTLRAYQSVFGFEYQGDSLLLARENLLYTFADNLMYKFHRFPTTAELKEIAVIISWNLWQMDGRTFSVPYSEPVQYCVIRDWKAARQKKKSVIEYRSLFTP